jgi:hypothetical protein
MPVVIADCIVRSFQLCVESVLPCTFKGNKTLEDIEGLRNPLLFQLNICGHVYQGYFDVWF